MTSDERDEVFKAGLQKLSDETGKRLQAIYSMENYNPSKAMLTIGVVLVDIDGWQPPVVEDDAKEEAD